MNIYGNNAGNLINSSVELMKEQHEHEKRKLIRKFLDYYEGDMTEKYIEDKFSAKAFQEVDPVCMNITKRFIDRMSRVYTLGASRTLPSQNDIYSSLTRFKDLKMKHLERMTRLLGTVAVQTTYEMDEYGIPYFDYHPIYYFEVFTDEMNPYKPIAIEYPIEASMDSPNLDENKKYIYWDAEKIQYLNEEKHVYSEEPNPYGFLPFCFLHNEHPIDNFFSAPNYSLVSCNQSINTILTEANLGLRFQMFGQYVVTGLYQDEKIQRAGSDEVIILPEGANLNIVTPKPNMTDALKLMRSMLEMVAQNNHLSITFTENNSDRPDSGIALKIKDLERHEHYQDDLDLYRMYEMKLYDLERAIARYNGFELPATIGIDFNEPEYPQTIPDQIAMESFMLDNDLTTKAKLLQDRNKDITLEEAQKIIDKNKEVNAKTKPAQSVFEELRRETT